MIKIKGKLFKRSKKSKIIQIVCLAGIVLPDAGGTEVALVSCLCIV